MTRKKAKTFKIRPLREEEHEYLEQLLRDRFRNYVQNLGTSHPLVALVVELKQALSDAELVEDQKADRRKRDTRTSNNVPPKRRRGRPRLQQSNGDEPRKPRKVSRAKKRHK